MAKGREIADIVYFFWYLGFFLGMLGMLIRRIMVARREARTGGKA